MTKMDKVAVEIQHYSGGQWHVLPRFEAATMLREAHSRRDCDRLYDRVYILHPAREYDSAVFIRTKV